MLARVFEEAGITTVTLALLKEHAERVKPPRALFVPFPFGYSLGRANDPEFQHRVISAAFDLLKSNTVPALAEFPENGEGSARLIQASAVDGNGIIGTNGTAANEVTALRTFYERRVASHEGRTAVGLSKVPPRRFRGMIRFLEGYAMGETPDYQERPADVPLLHFIRYFVDDLKAFYYEARIEQRPEASEDDLHRWFWGDTAGGKLVADLAAYLNASDDPAMKGVAFGLAR